jgi:hypothetical protein
MFLRTHFVRKSESRLSIGLPHRAAIRDFHSPWHPNRQCDQVTGAILRVRKDAALVQ